MSCLNRVTGQETFARGMAATRDYSLAIISRRSAMCFLTRAIFSGQETRPW